MAETPLGLTYPGSGDHTRLWEHIQSLAEDVDSIIGGLLLAMGDYDPAYTNVRHDLNNVGTAEDVSPAFALSWTNPLDRDVIVKSAAYGYMYVEPGSGTTYLQVKPTETGDVTQLNNMIHRANIPEGATSLNYSSFYCFTYVRVAAGATADLRLWGRRTAAPDAYVQYVKIDAMIVGLAS